MAKTSTRNCDNRLNYELIPTRCFIMTKQEALKNGRRYSATEPVEKHSAELYPEYKAVPCICATSDGGTGRKRSEKLYQASGYR